jgi:hypothetical protein
MTFVVVRPAGAVSRCAVLIGALSLSVACGGERPESSGSGGVQAEAGMSGGGVGGASVTGGGAGMPSTTGGVGGAGANAGGTGTMGGAGGTGAMGGTGMTGSGGTNAGTGGMTGGSGGMAGAPPTGGGGAGGANATGGSGGMQALSFRTDIYPVFQMIRNPAFVYPGAGSFDSCNDTGVCHGGDVAPGAGLGMMDVNMAYAELVGVMSESELCNGTLRVAAGNPEQSCLILFYEGRLRDELDWVDDVEIDFMRRWIAEGALP